MTGAWEGGHTHSDRYDQGRARHSLLPCAASLTRGSHSPAGLPRLRGGGQGVLPTVCFVSCAGCLRGTWAGSVGKRLLLWGECSSELLGVLGASPGGDGNRSSFCPLRLSRAGLMRGLRWRREPELEATEPATEGAGEGSGEEGQLPARREK